MNKYTTTGSSAASIIVAYLINGVNSLRKLFSFGVEPILEVLCCSGMQTSQKLFPFVKMVERKTCWYTHTVYGCQYMCGRSTFQTAFQSVFILLLEEKEGKE